MKTIALVGNPNTGKTTLFNSILHADEHVGNWHGVTVEYKEKIFKRDGKAVAQVTDLPGVYSLSSFSFEEAVTREYLIAHKDATILNIIDGNCLQKNLLLTLELIECGFSPIVCINMANEMKKYGIKIDTKKIEKMLGVKVFLINAQDKKVVKQLFDYVLKYDTQSQKAIKMPYVKKLTNIFDTLYQKYLQSNSHQSKQNFDDFQKIKMLELDSYFCDNISKSNIMTSEFSTINSNNESLFQIFDKNNTLSQVFKARYDYINLISVEAKETAIYGYSKVDRFVLNKYLGIPIFLIIVAIIFFLTFGELGTFLTEKLSLFFETYLFLPLTNFVQGVTNNQFVINFFSEAICGSVGTIFSFLPQIVLMYLGLYFLEESGYMARIAFMFEDFMQKIGLTGKSIFTLLMCFGCSTTATLSSRNQDDKNSKIKTAMLTPYMSCSAKLPLYSVVSGALFPKNKFLVIISFYLLGVLVALAISYFLNKKYLKSENSNFILEMPAYRFPRTKKIVKNVLTNTKDFLLRAGSVLLCFSCIIWTLKNLQYGSSKSVLDWIASFISPLFVPLGFGTQGVVLALLCGIVAKEIIVSTIGIVNNLGGNSAVGNISKSIMLSSSAFFLTTSSSLSFLVFATLYLPCISTVSVMAKEIGKKWTLMSCIIQFLIAYLLSFVTYKISNYFVFYGVGAGILSLLCFAILLVAIFFITRLFKSKKSCRFCPKRKTCGK